MKLALILAFVAMAAARPDASRYDNFDVEEMISNKRLLKAYVNCFLDVGKCTSEGNDFKKWIPSTVQDSCSKCTEKQKTLVTKVILAIKADFPEDWNKLNNVYDSEGKYETSLNEFLKKYGQ